MKSNRLERYLQEASQGLYGKQRKMVIKELRGNLEQHVKERMAFGMSEVAAYEEMLDAFGAPQIVSRGMWGVHMKPMILKIGAVLGLTTTLSLPFVVASAESIRTWSPSGASVYISLDDAFKGAGWKNAKAEIKGREFKIDKGGKNLLLYYFDKAEAAKNSIIYKDGEKYISQFDFTQMFSRYEDGPVTFDQPINPTITVVDKQLSLGNEKEKIDLTNEIIYTVENNIHDYIGSFLPNNHFLTNAIEPGKGYQHYIRGNAEPNHPYLAIWAGWEKTIRSPKNAELSVRLGILQSDKYGDFKFETAYPQVYFADKWETLGHMKNNQILLVKMTGRLNASKYQKYDDIIDPSSVLKIPISIGHKAQ